MNSKTITRTVALGLKELEVSIKTNIRNILLTGRGEVPFRPRFGLGAERLLGGGMSGIDLIYEVSDQLSRYEPRITVKQIAQQELSPGRRAITIYYQIKETGEQNNITIS